MEHSFVERKKGLSGTALKLIAIVTMVIDHIGAVVIEAGFLDVRNFEHFNQLITTEYGKQWLVIDSALRFIGRISFPIFCFLLAEGFFHTKNRNKYAANMLIFAFISEIPFDLAVFNKVLYWDYQNIYFTLFLGLLVMIGMECVSSSYFKQMLVVAGGCVMAYMLRTDYNIWGIILIASFYMYHGNKKKQLLVGGAAAALESSGFLGAAAIAMIPIWKYNGERGKFKMKYFFYCFYPAHLLILYVVRLIVVKEF